jgi:hypothetical protein
VIAGDDGGAGAAKHIDGDGSDPGCTPGDEDTAAMQG